MKKWGRAPTTGDLLQGLKSTVKARTQKQGSKAEDFVCRELVRSGWQVHSRRWKTPYAEIDILASNTEGYFSIIEVKRIRSEHWSQNSISSKQKARLIKASLWLTCKKRFGVVTIKLALVNGGQKIEFIDMC